MMNAAAASVVPWVEPGVGDCSACPAARPCWGFLPAPGTGFCVRREPLLRRGSVLRWQGEYSPAVHIVGRGCLLLREVQPGGLERVVGYRLPGELLGLESWARGTSSCTAEACATSVVCRIMLPVPGGAPAQPAYPALLERLLLKCAPALDPVVPRWRGLPAVDRVAAFVEEFATRSRVPAGGAVELPMTRAQIGSYIELSEETVVRSLRKLRARGRLEVRGRWVRLMRRSSGAN